MSYVEYYAARRRQGMRRDWVLLQDVSAAVLRACVARPGGCIYRHGRSRPGRGRARAVSGCDCTGRDVLTLVLE